MAAVEAEQVELDVETEAERVFRWRAEALERAGYGERWAFKLALRNYVDLHLAVDLLRRGCPADTAVRILI